MKVKDIMVRDVISVTPEETFYDVVELFARKKISGAPVVKGDRPIGIVSESDLMRLISAKDMVSLVEGGRKDVKEKAEMKVQDFMKPALVTVKPDDDLRDVIKTMNAKDVNRVPVVQKNKLVGIITRADVVSVISEYLTEHPLVRKREGDTEDEPVLETNIDMLLALVKEKGSVKFSDAAKKFGVPEKMIEEWGAILEEYRLAKLHYPPIGTPAIKINKEKYGRKRKNSEG